MYKVLTTVTLELNETSEHVAGPMEYQAESTFEPVKDGFAGTQEDIDKLVTEGVLLKLEEYDGPMAMYRITGPFEYGNEKGEVTGKFEIGTEVSLPTIVGDKAVEDGVAVKLEEKTEETVVSGDANVAAAPAEKPRFYMQKQIISHVMRKVEDKFYHHVRLEDGSTHDLTNEEYEIVMKD